MEYFLRTYIETDKNLVQKQALELVTKLNQFSDATLFKTQPYWKIPEYFEVSVDMKSDLKQVELAKKIASHWTVFNACYIWNIDNEDSPFLLSNRVRWASLEWIE